MQSHKALIKLLTNLKSSSKFDHYPSYPGIIIEVKPGALDRIWHPPGDHKWET